MSEIDRILDQLIRAWQGPAWHGPSLMEVLDGVDARTAARRPIAQAHTIHEIVAHVRVWEDVTRRRLAGEPAEPTPEEDWPRVADSDAAWAETRGALERGHMALREAIRRFPETRLDEMRPGSETSFYVLMQGVVQHDLYHAGQIILLRKG